MSLEDGDGYVPAHRLMKKLTSWSQATAKPTPTTLTVNAVVESAFMKLARLEAEAVEAPPAAIGQRPSGKKGAIKSTAHARDASEPFQHKQLSRVAMAQPHRCCPGHQAGSECHAVSPHNSRKVEEVEDNGDEVRESLVTRREEKSTAHARDASEPFQHKQLSRVAVAQ